MSETMNKVRQSVQRREDNIKQNQDILQTPEFRVSDKVQSEFDMWVWIYQEIANIRMEVSRLGVFVRVNNVKSPEYLRAYHAHLMSFLLPISVVIANELWDKVEKFWLQCEREINEYLKVRGNLPNKKIPDKLIKNLDKLYRVALISAQKAGLGFKVNIKQDFENAIERAIQGS